MGARKTAGYGNFCVERRTSHFVLTHRYAYELTYGPIPEGEVVRHRCDNPPCCNPAHLIAGTQKENIADAIGRGRLDPVKVARIGGPLGGLVNGKRSARLADVEVISIIRYRAAGITVSTLAQAFEVDRTLIFNILEGRTYCWIPLVHQIAELRRQGIYFPRTDRKDYSIDLLHPLLREVIDAIE
jgi:hypothetical protein